ncbi:hypothetical protein MACJ_002368 [Theileria orientalis]|uniref:Uncharacterized protein n=1 Tax=Theileria orientalis TaxID=68886 RepID=A0A976QSA2_THEOR|nr:hypothetical protein MACJ_002368 [Theileria orientalis]
MYTYKLYLFVTYLLGLRWSFLISVPLTEATNNITLDLRNLTKHGSVEEVDTGRHTVKEITFTTPQGKIVDKVVYLDVDVWVASSHPNKVLKKLVVTNKKSMIQLLHVVMVPSTGGSTTEENVYYKKQKKQFEVVQLEKDYTRLKNYLKARFGYFTDSWFVYDFGDKPSYSRFVGENKYLVDGVWKITFTPLNDAKPLLVRQGEQNLWTLENDSTYVSSTDLYDFGADNLLVFKFRDTPLKFYHKLKIESTWKTVESLDAFNTKANQLKADYFTTALDYDLSMKPDYNKFWINRKTLVGNVSDLTFNPTRTYFVNKLKFGDQVLWTSSNRENRVDKMKLTLFGYEVKAVQFSVTKGSTKLDPEYDVFYYHKDISNSFKSRDKDQYKKAVDLVKSVADRSKQFNYVNTWERVAARLDLATYNASEFNVETAEGANGVVTETLTPRQNMWFASLGFRDANVWPSVESETKKPTVKNVVLVKKNSLLQLVKLTTAGDVSAEHAGAVDSNYFFKKNGDTFVTVDTKENFESNKSNLESGDTLLDDLVHLDVNTDELNTLYYTVSTEVVDGVDKRVVKVKTLKVTKLTNFAFALWTRPAEPPTSNAYVTGYEMYTFGEKKLLKVLVTESVASNSETFEKTGESAQWVSFTGNFNDKLAAMKNVTTWTPVELDVSVSPSLTNFDVVVTPVKGNRTKLLLTPKKMKKVTKVKLGTTKEFFTTADSNRAYKVELYLEYYEPKFVNVFVWKDVTNQSPQKTEEKHVKVATDGAANWVTNDFDEKLKVFKEEENTVQFTYSPDWVPPPSSFDPKSFSKVYFSSEDATADLVTTTTYTPRAGTVVKKVLLDGAKVWPEGDVAAEDPTKKLVSFKVLSKNDMVQLLHLTNALVATPGSTEELYFKKSTYTYPRLTDVAEFNKLKASLNNPDKYVDDKVKLDLSSTEEASTKLFDKETKLEDGVVKTVVKVKAGKLFEVTASPHLWKSTDGSFVTVLERYALNDMQLLVLHVTKTDGSTEKIYFEKTLSPPAQPSSPQRPEDHHETQVQQQVVDQGQQESQVQEVSPAKRSFEPLTGKSAFFDKLNKAKAAVQHHNVPLDVQAYTDSVKFEVKETREGNTTLYKVYPKTTYRVTSLVNGTGTNLWTQEEDGERLVEAFLYLHDRVVKFVRALVWSKDHTDLSKDKLFHFKLDNGQFLKQEKEAFEADLKAVATVEPTPLETETLEQPPETPFTFHKFYLSENVDSKIFELTERKKGVYKLKNYTPKENKFVNLVETQHGVLWKAEDNEDLMKSTFFAVTENSALAHLTLSVNSQPQHLFFKFEDDTWLKLDNKTYVDLYTKAGLSSS